MKRRLVPMIVSALLALATFSAAASAQVPLSLEQKIELANRFRPFIMTSMSGLPRLGLGEQEVFRPASWQWFVARATLVQNYESFPCVHGVVRINQGSDDVWPQGSPVKNPSTGAAISTADLADGSILSKVVPHGDIRGIDSLNIDQSYALHVNDAPSGTEDFRHGESWSDVIANGDGFYAHVEAIPQAPPPSHQFINIEYTIFWAYNSSVCDYHNGDITTMVVIYDLNTDLIARLIYSVHGYAIEQFNLAHGKQYDSYPLLWKGLNGSIDSIPAMAVTIPDDRQYQQGGTAHSPGDPIIFLVQDPDTGRFEHPVAMAEVGGHELWPNTSGKITAAAAHFGEGFSFLAPKAAFSGVTHSQTGMQMLQRDTDDSNSPFLFFNGLMGTDGLPPLRHRTWFWPETREANQFHIPETKFSDPDVYASVATSGATFNWPPDPDYVNSNLQVFVASGLPRAKMTAQPKGRKGVPASLNATQKAPTAKLSDPSHPFDTVLGALSATPCGGTLVLGPGNYRISHSLERACSSGTEGPIRLVAAGGPVVLTN